MPTYRDDLHSGHKVPLVETDDILNGAITTDKISDSAVTTEKIADGAVTHDKMAPEAISDLSGLEEELTGLVQAANTATQNANNAAENASRTNMQILDAENARINSENDRRSSEQTRKSNEDQRIEKESQRQQAESERNSAESERNSAEDTRQYNEGIRREAETYRNDAESERINNENSRKAAEIVRQHNEGDRGTAETNRSRAESQRVSNEQNRIAAEEAREQALLRYINDGKYNSQTKRIELLHDNTIIASIDATPFIVDGMVDDVRIENGYLIIDFNTASGKQDISIPLTAIFNPANYYTKSDADSRTIELLGEMEFTDNVAGSSIAPTEARYSLRMYWYGEYETFAYLTLLSATQETAGLMSAADKAKLDNIDKDLEKGNLIPALAYNLEAWSDQRAIVSDERTDAVRTSGGDIPIETSYGVKQEKIRPTAGSKWTAKMLFNGSYNMLNAAKWGAANNQPYVGGIGSDFVYFLVPELTLGTFGTAEENNGLLFTDEEGVNIQPASVYFKPLGTTIPQSLTDGTSITPTNVSYDGKTYKDYATDGAGWLIIPKSYYDNDVCAHIAWEDWYDKYVSLNEPVTNPEAIVGTLILEGLLAFVHSDKYLRGVNDDICDYIEFGDTSAIGYHMVDEISIAAASWNNSATGESDSQGNALYRHSTTVSGIKQGGAACVEGNNGGIPLTVNGTTVSYVDTNATAPASVVFYQIPTTEVVEKAYTDNVFSGSNIDVETGIMPINDCSIEAQIAMDGEAIIIVKYAKNIVDQVAINATVDVPQIKKQVENHEERITELEDTAVRTGSYDASVAVGLADNFKGDTIVDAEFYKRKTGGTQSVGSGIAAIKEVRGKSIVWNQLITLGNGTTTVNDLKFTYGNGKVKISGTPSADGNFSLSIIDVPANHKIFISQPSTASKSFYFRTNASNAYSWSNVSNQICVLISNATRLQIVYKKDFPIDDESFPQLFDLTLMFGAGNEPATVEEFKKMFPLDYYDYNKGTIIPFAGQNLVTIGKNQYNPVTGKANLLGSKQYQIKGTYTKLYPTVSLVDYTYGSPVISGTYYTNADSHYVGAKAVSAYDNTKTYVLGSYCINNDTIYKSNVAIETAEEFDSTKWDVIADVAAMISEGVFTLWDITPDANGLFTLTKNTEVTIVGGNDTDTIVALYNGENNTFEPYEKHTLPLDPSQWRDKNGELVFPYGGMHGVGTAYDYAKVDADGYIRKAVRCFGQVDLGSLDWEYKPAGTTPYFSTILSTINMASNSNLVITPMYTANKAFWTKENMDKCIASGGTYLNVSNSNYSDASTFKSGMNGVMCVFILATPVEVELATPIYAKYLVDKDGTEEITPANGTTPYTTMANLSILYAMDARGEIKNLPKNYLSKESAENMLNAMASAGVIAGYTMTWDAANNRYAFTFQKSSEPEEQQE